jgi:hypothetical protein
LRGHGIEHILKLGQNVMVVAGKEKKKSGWLWPLGMMVTGLGAAGVVLFRGCWHGKMSWPVRSQDYSYQVCLGCGIKRLFDEKAFRAYGPYSYDLKSLIARDRARTSEIRPETEPSKHRTAS